MKQDWNISVYTKTISMKQNWNRPVYTETFKYTVTEPDRHAYTGQKEQIYSSRELKFELTDPSRNTTRVKRRRSNQNQLTSGVHLKNQKLKRAEGKKGGKKRRQNKTFSADKINLMGKSLPATNCDEQGEYGPWRQ